MTELEQGVLLTAFALAYKDGIKDMDEAVSYSEYMLSGSEEVLVSILRVAFKKFLELNEYE